MHGERDQRREPGGAVGRRRTALLAGLLVLQACRDADPAGAGQGIALPIVPNVDGSSGCVGPDPTFVLPLVPTAVDLDGLVLSPSSQVAAARGAELLYVTGADGTVAVVDLADPGQPQVSLLVSPGTVAALLADLGAPVAPDLSGLAVLSAQHLVVMEHAANVLLRVGRVAPDDVALLAGLPNAVPGFADGPALPNPFAARFSFDRPSMVVPTEGPGGGKELFLADSGNHAIRRVAGGAVRTIVGDGLPATLDGTLEAARLDTPVGLVATCSNALLVTEVGAFGGGQVLRRLGLQSFPPFGELGGELLTVLGVAGEQGTVGGPVALARLSSPTAPATTAEGDVFWIDSGSGVLRRLAAGLADCPSEPACEDAVAAPIFTPGGVHSIALTDAGGLYVLDADAGTLWRVVPR